MLFTAPPFPPLCWRLGFFPMQCKLAQLPSWRCFPGLPASHAHEARQPPLCSQPISPPIFPGCYTSKGAVGLHHCWRFYASATPHSCTCVRPCMLGVSNPFPSLKSVERHREGYECAQHTNPQAVMRVPKHGASCEPWCVCGELARFFQCGVPPGDDVNPTAVVFCRTGTHTSLPDLCRNHSSNEL